MSTHLFFNDILNPSTYNHIEIKNICKSKDRQKLSLSLADYKKIDSLQDTKNIIYPILDVLQKVQPLAAENRYYTARLYALGKSRVAGSFVQDVFQRDAYCESNKCNLQVTAHALGMALRLEDVGRAAGLDVD